MAETAILSVSLKQYKQEIDNLKGSLLGLEKTSDDYKKIAEEIRGRQQKLNEVMSVGKKEVDSTANSMNGLKAHLRELKDEVGNLDLGSEEFKKVSEEILATTNKLKALEEAQGTFSRNVGNYKNAFLSAFSEMKEGPVGVIKGLTTLGANMDGMIAKNGSLGASFASLGSTIKTNVIGAFNVLVKHPIVATITLLGSLVALLVSKMNMSEQATRKWNKAMAVFQPVVRLVQRAIGFLVEKIADFALWVANKVPNALRAVGKGFKGFINTIANVVDAYAKFVGFIEKATKGFTDVVLKGFGGLLKGAAAVAEALGADSIAKKIQNIAHSVENFKGVSSILTNAANSIRGFGNAVEGFFGNAAQSAEYSMQLAQQQQDLEDEIRTKDKEYAESQKKQAELRQKIAKASGQERLKLLKELREETEKGNKVYIKAKEHELQLQKKLMDLTPNSKEDNEKYSRLQAEYAQLEAQAAQANVGIAKLEKRTETQIENAAKAAEKAREKDEKERKRALEKAQKEYEQAVQKRYLEELKYLKNKQTLLELELKGVVVGSKEELEIRKKLVETKYELLVMEANRSIRTEAERLEKIKLLQQSKNAELLKLQDDFHIQTVERTINNLKLLEKAYGNSNPVMKASLTVRIAFKELAKEIESDGKILARFVDDEREGYQKVVQEFYNSISQMGDFSIYGIKEKLKTLPNVLQELAKKGDWINAEHLGNQIIKKMFNIDINLENRQQVIDALDPFFKQVFGDLSFEDYVNIFIGKVNEQDAKIQKAEAERLKNVTDAVNERIKLRESETELGTRANLEYYKNAITVARRELEDIEYLEKSADETEEQFQERRINAQKKLNDALVLLAENSVNGEKYFNALKEDEQLRHNEEMTRLAQELEKILNRAEKGEDVVDEQREINERIEAEERRHSKVMQKIDNDQAKKQKMTWQKGVDVAVQSTQSMASVLNDYATYKNNQLEEDVKRGKKSEEQAKEEFEDLKKFQIAATAMNMLASLVSINTSVWSDKSIPSTWAKIALSATQSAAALMSGHLAIQQIKQTEYGSDSSSSSMSSSSPSTVDFSAVGVNPLLDENSDMNRISNVNVINDETSGGDRRVWILQSDIEDSNRQVAVRQSATTF